jgi:hypothetical protein
VKKEKDNLKHDEYFIKYEIQSSSLPYYGVKLNITKSNESSQNVQEIINTGNWERTIGPVKKGYVADLKAVKSNWDGKPEYHLKMTLSISVSKNGMPFTHKKIDDNNNKARATANIQYILD